MNKSDVMYSAKSNGYFFVQDNKGFISVFDTDEIFTEDNKSQCIYREKSDCKNRVDFEMETIYIYNKLSVQEIF